MTIPETPEGGLAAAPVPDVGFAWADGPEFPIEVSLSPTVDDSGTATIAIIRDVSHRHALDRNERCATELHDRVINHLYGSGLGLASVLARDRLDDEDKRRLRDVIGELDTAVRIIRDSDFARLERDLRIKQPN